MSEKIIKEEIQTTKVVFSFDGTTKEFIGEEMADIDPFDKSVLLATNSTEVEPIEVSEGNIAVFDGNSWVKEIDNRGQTYWLKDGSFHTILDIGEELPENALLEEPDTRSLSETKKEAVENINQIHASNLKSLTGNATIEERDTWQAKALASEALLKGEANEAQQVMLGTEAQFSGITPQQLAEKVVAKYVAYQKLIGLAAGLKSKAEREIEACTTKKQVASKLEALGIEMQGYIDKFVKAEL